MIARGSTVRLAQSGEIVLAPSYRAEYRIWTAMRQRCSNPRNQGFRHYAGRVSVCEQWMTSFEKFYADMGPRPSPKHSLDRIDNHGNYEPGNVRWATPKTQARNTSRTCMIEVGGVVKPLTQWAEELGISPQSFRYRLKHWPADVATSRTKSRRRLKLKPRSPRGPRRVGSAHNNSKLVEAQVAEIIAAHSNGETNRSIAVKYGVDCSTISLIVNRKTWKHVSCDLQGVSVCPRQ